MENTKSETVGRRPTKFKCPTLEQIYRDSLNECSWGLAKAIDDAIIEIILKEKEDDQNNRHSS